MSGITSGTGLFSGLPTTDLINQLIQVEARPRAFAQQRIVQLQSQQAAWLAINSALNGVGAAAGRFRVQDVFDRTTASSTNESVLTATASNNATEGSYSFIVDRLVSTQQLLTRGFSDRDETGIGASRFTFETGGGGVRTSTRLTELNGGEGIDRGTLRITDKAGNTADIDVSRAVNVDDVLEAINENATVNVNARVDGDRLVIDDLTGAGGTLRIEDVAGSETASTLGIAGQASGVTTSITGTSVRNLSDGSALSVLNDGNGVNILDGNATADLTITARDGTQFTVNLGRQTGTEEVDGEEQTVVTAARAGTLGDVIERINQAATNAGVDVVAGFNADGTGLVVNDNSAGGGDLVIESTGTRTAAEDLGIATDGFSGASFEGRRLIAGINSVLSQRLNGGSGLGSGELNITDRAGNATTINLSDGALGGSLSDVIDEVNATLAATGVSVTVGYNTAGNGIALSDTSGGSGSLVVSGDTAQALGIDTAGAASNELEGRSSQLQWISRATQLEDLNAGEGIGSGTIRLTNAAGDSTEFTVGSSVSTVGELLSFINSRPDIGVNATINDQGDGIVLTDTTGGGGQLIIEDVTGSVASNLNIDGTFSEEGGVTAADGSFERVVEFDPTDDLDTVAEEINLAGVGLVATVINDGAPGSPFRLSLTARDSGSAGRTIFDSGGLDLGVDTIAQGDDAVVFYGAADPKDAVLITSSTNSLSGVVRGVNINLRSASDDPVELTVSRDLDSIESEITGFVESFNGAIRAIDQTTFYNEDTEQRGPLLGNSTASIIRRRLIDSIQSPIEGVPGNRFRFLFEIGIGIEASGSGEGNRISFDTEKFREAYASDPEAVRDLFDAFKQEPRGDIEIAPGITTPDLGPERFSRRGVLVQIDQLVDSLTSSIGGLVTRQTDRLDDQIRLQEGRIENFNAQLERKRAQLEAEFAGLEQVLAQLQTQQQSLGQLQGLG